MDELIDDLSNEVIYDDIVEELPSETSVLATAFTAYGEYITPIVEDPEFRSKIVEGTLTACLTAFDEINTTSSNIDFGVRTQYLLRSQAGGSLAELGFICYHDQGQVQFYNASRYPFPVRIMFAVGSKISGGFRVPSKGSVSRNLINNQNNTWSSQTTMFSDEPEIEEEVCQNYWVLAECHFPETGGIYLTIHLVLPIELRWSGAKMVALDQAILFNGPISPAPLTVDELPLESEIDFGIDEVFSLEDDFESGE